MKMPFLLLAALLVLLVSAGCASSVGSGLSGSSPPEADDLLRFSAEVVFVPIEGGFFGLTSDDGRRFDPDVLPPAFQHHGMRVKVTGRLVPQAVGFHMWGARIEVLSIEQE